MNSSLKAVLFDLDGVLTNTVPLHYKANKMLAEDLGVFFDHEMNMKLQGRSRMDAIKALLKQKEGSYSHEEKLKLGEQRNTYYQALIEELTPEDLLPGVKDFLEQTRAAGFKAVLTSSSTNARTVISNVGIKNYFDHIVDVHTISNRKPDPEIFLKGAEMAGVSPKECAGIEDSEAGIRALQAAGIFSVGVGEEQAAREADWFVDSTRKLQIDVLIRRFKERNG
ncbi:beta-phosphoglucomutase [Bacillus sp. FJAT-44742]|uniref:beta-phosphoglucomutase n=1 Tax=Bacillus sp. FJAT-44742 TaxID=2014005 RepID=UPI0012FEFF88|nr:beta-phosphoglucomutase [Bacillus sp. FJAT-44742]